MIHHQHQHRHPTVEIPPWDPQYDDPAATTPIFSPQTHDYFAALQRYLPSSESYDAVYDSDDTESSDLPFDSFSCDNFRMFEFKVRKCARGRSHDWTECPYAHPGEKARRRDPRKYHYSGTPCPEFRRGSCRKGDSCEFAHGVFECWLHPARYRTQPCKDGPLCKRRVCFFAHSPDQLRILPHSDSPPPGRLIVDSDSPPMSPSYSSVGELVGAMRGLQIGVGKIGSMSMSPRWVGPASGSVSGFGSPRSPTGYMGGFCGGSVPTTPTRTPTRSGLGLFDPWDPTVEEEPVMERVESGKSIRAKMYARLSKENSLDRDRVDPAGNGPDFGWVSELVK